MSEVLKYPRGTALQFTSGEYSDFCTRGLVVTIKDLDLHEAATAYMREQCDATPDEDRRSFGVSYDLGGFVSWLVAQGYAMPADVEEVHLGEYDRFAFGERPTHD
jgi:hypothetical protein